jgi:hypothetical protein
MESGLGIWLLLKVNLSLGYSEVEFLATCKEASLT